MTGPIFIVEKDAENVEEFLGQGRVLLTKFLDFLFYTLVLV